MVRRYTSAHSLRLLPALLGVLLIALLLAPAALATVGSSPITWLPADSSYGVAESPFVAVPMAPAGTGATSLGPGAAFGGGFWDGSSEVYVMGFADTVLTGMPGIQETELSSTPLYYGVPLKLVFQKTAGQRIDSVAILGDPGSLVSIEPADPAALTAATQFTVRATVTDPVQSRSGNVGAAFGLCVDCSSLAARDFQGSLFVTNMHWLDIDPPTFSSTGLAGLTAHGSPGTEATFDGIFAPAFLTAMGFSDFNDVQGYVDVTAVTGWTGAALTVPGVGDGSLWPAASWKYRITNSNWCTHNILFGRLTSPAKAVGVSPRGTVTTTRPTFRWKKTNLAAKYEVRVYKGSRLLLKKTGSSLVSWKASKALPRGVYLTWKVRAVNSAGAGSYSSALKFKVR
jgi:hypothetical protein